MCCPLVIPKKRKEVKEKQEKFNLALYHRVTPSPKKVQEITNAIFDQLLQDNPELLQRTTVRNIEAAIELCIKHRIQLNKDFQSKSAEQAVLEEVALMLGNLKPMLA